MWHQAATNLVSQFIDISDSISSLSVTDLQTRTSAELQAVVMRSWRFHAWSTSNLGSSSPEQAIQLVPRQSVVMYLSGRLLPIAGGGSSIHGPHRFVGPNHFVVLSTWAIYLWDVHGTDESWVDVLKYDHPLDRGQGFIDTSVEVLSERRARMVVSMYIEE